MSADDGNLEVSGMAAPRGHRSMSMAALPTISGIVEAAAAEAAAAAAVTAEAEAAEAEAKSDRANVESADEDDGGTGGGAGGGGGETDSISLAPAVPPLRLSGVVPAHPGPVPFPLGPTTINDDDPDNGEGSVASADDTAEFLVRGAAAQPPPPQAPVTTQRHGDLLDGEPDSEPPSAYQSPTMSPSITKGTTWGYGIAPGSPAAAVNIPAAAAEKMMVLWERRAAVAAAAAEVDGECMDSGGGSRSSLLNKVRSMRLPGRRGLAAAGLHSIQNRWRRVSNAVAGIMRAHKLVAADHSEFVNDNKSALMQAQTGKLDVALEVKDARDLDKINYVRQGNRDMYSGDMINKRRALRTHPQVMEAIRAWWRWLPKSATRVVVVVGGGGDEEDEVFAATLDEPIYSAMVVAVTMVLLPRFNLPVDENYDPKEDWLDDNKGLPYMDFPNFFDALFELVDMWSEGVGGPEYAELLRFLLHGVQEMEKRHGKFGRLLKRFGHKPAPQITPAAPSGGAAAGRTPQKSQAKGKTGGGAGGAGGAIGTSRSPRVSTVNGNGHGNSENSESNGNGATHDSGGGGGHQNVNGRRRPDRPSDLLQGSPPSSPGAMGMPSGRAVKTSDASRGKLEPRVGPAPPHTPSLSTPPQPRQHQSALPMQESFDDQSLSAWQSQRRLPPMASGSSGSGGSSGAGGLGVGSDGSEDTRPALAPPSRSSRSPTQGHDHDYVDYSAIPSTLGAYLRQPLPKAPPKPTGGSGAGGRRLSNGRRTSEGGGGGSDSPSAAALQRHQQGGDTSKARDTGSGSDGSGYAYPTTSLLQSPAAGANTTGGIGGAGTVGAGSSNSGAGSGGGSGAGGGGQQLSHIVFGGNWQLGEGWLSQDGAALAAVGVAGGGGTGSGSRVYGSQVLTFPNVNNGLNGQLGGMFTRRGHNLGAGLRNAMSTDLPYDNPYVAPGSLYAEYMDAVMSRHALRQHGGGGTIIGSIGGGGGGAAISSSLPLPPTGVPGLAVLGAPPPLGPRSLQHAVLTVNFCGGSGGGGGNGRRDSTSTSLDKGASNDSGAGAASGHGPVRRRPRPALLHVTGEAGDPLSVQNSVAELPDGQSPQPPEQQHQQPQPSLSFGVKSEVREEEDMEEEQLQLEQQDLLGRSFGNELQERGILPSVSTSSSDRADCAEGGNRGSVSPSAASPPSTAATWFSSPPPMPGPPRNTRHTFLYAAAPSTAPSTPNGSAGAVPAPPPMRATPSAGICLVEMNGVGGGVSGGGGGGGDSTGGGDGSSGSATIPPSPFGRGRGMGPAPILISVNSSPSLAAHNGNGGGGGGGMGLLPGGGGGSRSPRGGSLGGADGPQGLAALSAAAAAHLPTINHHSSPLLQESSGNGMGVNSHGGSPSRFHSQHQHPHLQPSGGGNGGSGAARGSSSVSPTARVSWGSSPAPGAGSSMGSGGNNGGGSGTGGGVLLPHLSLDSRLGIGSGGGGGRGIGGIGSSGSRGCEMPPPPPPASQARRDVVQASRAQVLSMAQAFLVQQQGNGSMSSAVNNNSISSRLESLRPLDGGLKRAQCGGSFLAYLQQGPYSGGTGAGSGTPAPSGVAGGGGSRVVGGGAARAVEPVPLTS